MHLELLPLSTLKPAPYNPRKPLTPGSPAYRRLAKSLVEFDLVQPVVWNSRTGHVVAGHQRLQILADQGKTDAECVVVDLPLPKEKALNVALNNPQVASTWDDAKLHTLLTELADLPDFDATLTGFDPEELSTLHLEPAPTLPPLTDEAPSPHIRVTLHIPPDDWEQLRPHLDDFAATHNLPLHITLPR